MGQRSSITRHPEPFDKPGQALRSSSVPLDVSRHRADDRTAKDKRSEVGKLIGRQPVPMCRRQVVPRDHKQRRNHHKNYDSNQPLYASRKKITEFFSAAVFVGFFFEINLCRKRLGFGEAGRIGLIIQAVWTGNTAGGIHGAFAFSA